MNLFVEQRFNENIRALAIGFELLDAGSRARIPHPIAVRWDGDASRAFHPLVSRHNSGVHALCYDPDPNHPDRVDFSYYSPEVEFPPLRPLARQRTGRVKTGFFLPLGAGGHVDFRFVDPKRRYVPRRLRFPVLRRSAAEAVAAVPDRFTVRTRRPVLFPGAAYDVSGSATGLRGRVTRQRIPVRWSRIEATMPITNVLVGRAHGDDRGEFLMLIESGASPFGGNLQDPLNVNVTVFVPAVPPQPSSADLPQRDPLWDLPLEVASAPGILDAVTAGEVIPPGYVAMLAGGTRVVPFRLGRILTGIEEKDFEVS